MHRHTTEPHSVDHPVAVRLSGTNDAYPTQRSIRGFPLTKSRGWSK